jgi:ABC-type molybdate transport system substrate-binding protein
MQLETDGGGSGCCDPALSQHDATLLVHSMHGSRQMVLPLLAAGAQAAELKVYASTAVKAVLEELGPKFEKATGDKVVFTFSLSAAVKKQIDEAAAFDVVILPLTLTTDYR